MRTNDVMMNEPFKMFRLAGGIVGSVKVLTNSLAIIEYLEETRPEKPLLPRDAFERARVRSSLRGMC